MKNLFLFLLVIAIASPTFATINKVKTNKKNLNNQKNQYNPEEYGPYLVREFVDYTCRVTPTRVYYFYKNKQFKSKRVILHPYDLESQISEASKCVPAALYDPQSRRFIKVGFNPRIKEFQIALDNTLIRNCNESSKYLADIAEHFCTISE